jgi:nicotinamide-nucleotide adenylyltransferase
VRGLLVGRFQPFHLGHLAVVQELQGRDPKGELVLGVGSAQASFTWLDPFTAGERLEMIGRALEEARVPRVRSIPLPDIGRHALWVAHVESLVPPIDVVFTNNPLTQALFERARYKVENPPVYDRARFQGSVIREQMAAGGAWAQAVPPSVARFLEEIRAVTRIKMLRTSSHPERS